MRLNTKIILHKLTFYHFKRKIKIIINLIEMISRQW